MNNKDNREVIRRRLEIIISQERPDRLAKRLGMSELYVRELRSSKKNDRVYKAYLSLLESLAGKRIKDKPVKKTIPHWEPPPPVTKVYYKGFLIDHVEAYRLLGQHLGF